MKGENDKKRFAVVLFWLSKRMMAQGGLPKKIDDDLQQDYFEALQDLRIERIEWAAKRIFADETWFPVPRVIRDAAMLAPSSVLPAIDLKQKALPRGTYHEDGAAKFQEILDGLAQRFDVPSCGLTAAIRKETKA